VSWAGYDALGPEVRGEYIDGELVMSPSPTQRHQGIAFQIHNLIGAAVPHGMTVIGGWAWMPGADEFVPDAMVLDSTDEQKRFT
jgi:Uma2 family endonuclease